MLYVFTYRMNPKKDYKFSIKNGLMDYQVITPIHIFLHVYDSTFIHRHTTDFSPYRINISFLDSASSIKGVRKPLKEYD